MDVIAHALLECGRVYEFALVVYAEPRSELRVPYKAVTHDKHIIVFAKLNELVGCFPIVTALFGMNFGRLHYIFRNNGVEVFCSYSGSQ